jgi:DinB superfamily
MNRPQTPYSSDLGDREPLAVMEQAVGRIGALVANWTPAQFERSYAPGKWNARGILVHLTQTELALGNRARMALAAPGYTAQAFDQDRWMNAEGSGGVSGSGGLRGASGAVAAQALVAMNAFNRGLFSSLSASERATPFSHPEYGALTVDWLIHQMAGHLLHHLAQIEVIAKQP